VKDQTGKAGKKMGLLGRIVFLQKLKDELIEKAKHPSTTYFQMTEIYKQMRQINIEIQNIKRTANDQKKQSV
jgi:hypothetical protein